MDLRAQRTVADSANWQVTIAWTTGIIVALVRAFALATVVLEDAPIGTVVLVWLTIEVVLTAALTYGIYRRSLAAAIGLFVLWAVGFVSAWVVNGRVLPPLGLIGVLFGIGLALGVRGTLTLRELRESGAPAA